MEVALDGRRSDLVSGRVQSVPDRPDANVGGHIFEPTLGCCRSTALESGVVIHTNKIGAAFDCLGQIVFDGCLI